MGPDAIPVRELASVATLPADAVRALFGRDAALRGTERVAVVRQGHVVARVAAEAGSALALQLDALDARAIPSATGLRLQGPVGVVDAPAPRPVQSRLWVPEGLKSAWRIGDEATVGLGPIALRVAVDVGDLGLAVDRALWVGAGAPETARWLPAVTWERDAPVPPDADPRVAVVPRRVITESDVRQARLRRQTIRLAPGQIVTPAARSLSRETGVLVEADPPARP